MKVFVVLAVAVACAYAKPQILVSGLSGLGHHYVAPTVHYSAPIAYSAPAIIAPAVTKTQYHAQDELGQASFGYAHPGHAHATVRDAFGNVRGSYAYINPEGKEVRVEYVADGAGFRVASNALPVGPVVPAAPELVAPLPVQDTPEVAEAKAAHEKAVQEAIARNAEAEKAEPEAEAESADKPQSRRKRGIVAAPVVVASPVHVGYAAVAAHPLRQATLTNIVHNPLHAVSYRVD